jgi:hypothetical protein
VDGQQLIPVAVVITGNIVAIQLDAADLKIHPTELKSFSTSSRLQIQSACHQDIARSDVDSQMDCRQCEWPWAVVRKADRSGGNHGAGS